MRISGGTAKGRQVKVRKAFSKKDEGDELRPTSAKVRKAIFDILGGRITDSRFLDLYAGTGAVGMEALSRGADSVVFVDHNRVRTGIIKKLASAWGFEGRAQVLRDRAVHFLSSVQETQGGTSPWWPFDIVFVDPPYASEELETVLPSLAGEAILSDAGVVVAEHSSKKALPPEIGSLRLIRSYKYGDTSLSLFKKEYQKGTVMKLAIYPGTFDPITNGHLDLVERGLRIFDRIIIAVAPNPRKEPFFSLEERLKLAKESVKRFKNVSVEPLGGLLVQYVKDKGGVAIIRGLRAVSDFELELQMALMNRRLDMNIETVFMMPCEDHSFLSSTIVKEVASFGGSVEGLVPDAVKRALTERFTPTEDIVE